MPTARCPCRGRARRVLHDRGAASPCRWAHVRPARRGTCPAHLHTPLQMQERDAIWGAPGLLPTWVLRWAESTGKNRELKGSGAYGPVPHMACLSHFQGFFVSFPGRFTRERSVVRNPPRPLREGLQMASLFGGQTIAPDVAGELTRVITRKTPRWRTSPRSVRGFAPVPGGPSTPATASWRVWSPAITGRLGLPRRRASRLGVAPTCSLPRRPRCCFGWDSSSSTRTQRSSAGELEGRPGDGTTQRRQAHPRPSE
jgi:hypothetical protein